MLELRTEVWKRLTFSKEGGAVPGSRFSPGPEAALCWEEGADMASTESPRALGHSEETSLSEMSPELNHCLASPRSERIEDSEGIVLPICPPSCHLLRRSRIASVISQKTYSLEHSSPSSGERLPAALCPLFGVLSLCPMLPELGQRSGV